MGNIMEKTIDLIKKSGLLEYQTRALAYLFKLGKTKAYELAKVSGIPKARIYDILEDLFKMGLITKRPGRPIIYCAIKPESAIENLIAFKKEKLKEDTKKLKGIKRQIIKELKSVYSGMETDHFELLKLIQVGVPSEKETCRIIDHAKKEINIATRAFEYYFSVKESLTKAKKRGVDIKILFLSPDQMVKEDVARQKRIIKNIKEKLNPKIKYSKEIPIRTTIVDSSNSYKTGKAIFLVEQKDVPLFMREAAITENPSLVYGLKLYFDSLWK